MAYMGADVRTALFVWLVPLDGGRSYCMGRIPSAELQDRDLPSAAA